MEVASRLLGEDVAKLAEAIDRAARPKSLEAEGRAVRMRSTTRAGSATLHNIVGVVPGTDPVLADEWVIVGAHYDHIGVGVRGRIGTGADDNGSGTSALLEIAQALAVQPARRSVLVCGFTAEEDGLVGSKRLATALPFPERNAVAMVNLDMIGRGKKEVAMVLGLRQNPGLEDVLKRARKLGKTGIKKVQPNHDAGLFQRSDHYSFHEVGIPSLFFMEDLSLDSNQEYHTWRDTLEMVDVKKVTNTARIAFLTTWILANDDERPSPPRD